MIRDDMGLFLSDIAKKRKVSSGYNIQYIGSGDIARAKTEKKEKKETGICAP